MSHGLRPTGEGREKIRRMLVRLGLLVFIVFLLSKTYDVREALATKQ